MDGLDGWGVLREGGLLVALGLALWSVLRGDWVPRRHYDAMLAERNRLLAERDHRISALETAHAEIRAELLRRAWLAPPPEEEDEP